MWWPWRHRESPQVDEARQRLDDTVKDDAKVNDLQVRTQRLIRENNLAPYVMKALGIRP